MNSSNSIKWVKHVDDGKNHLTVFVRTSTMGRKDCMGQTKCFCKKCYYTYITWPKAKHRVVKKVRKGYCDRCKQHHRYISRERIAQLKAKERELKLLQVSLTLKTSKVYSFIDRLHTLVKRYGPFHLEYVTKKEVPK
jgi:hypothetical protein